MRETDGVTWWAAIDTESVSDSGSSITVLVVSLTLVALGIALLGVTVWFWRLTRPDPDALGPLAVMSDRDFQRRGPIEQRRALDAARPDAVAIDAPEESADVDGGLVGDVDVEDVDRDVIDVEMSVDEDLFVEPEPVDEPTDEMDDDMDDDMDEDMGEEMDEDPAPVSRPGSIDPLL